MKHKPVHACIAVGVLEPDPAPLDSPWLAEAVCTRLLGSALGDWDGQSYEAASLPLSYRLPVSSHAGLPCPAQSRFLWRPQLLTRYEPLRVALWLLGEGCTIAEQAT